MTKFENCFENCLDELREHGIMESNILMEITGCTITVANFALQAFIYYLKLED